MYKIFIILFITFIISACGGNDSVSSNTPKGGSMAEVAIKNSKLKEYMDESKICDVISVKKIQETFGTTAEIKVAPRSNKYSKSIICNYSWDRQDAEQRKKEFLTYTIDQMQGKVEKKTMRERVLEHNFSIQLAEFKGNLRSFIPPKLTEEQLAKQITSAEKRAADRLTDKQKAIAGDAANLMLEKMLRQNNENVHVSGVGDSAYWSAVAGGGLNVLSGNIKISISLMIGDSIEEDMKNAEKIAQLIL